MKNRLQQIINNSYDIQSPNQISMLFQLGIGSNLSAYSGYSASKMRGYLEIDENKLNDSVQNHIEDLEKIFGYDTNNDYITDNGIAYLLNQYLASFSKQGGIIDGKELKMEVKPGDKILYSKYAGTDFKLTDGNVTIIRQSDILAIVL